VINLPTVSSGYSELYCRSGARRKWGEAESWRCRKTMERRGAQSRSSQSGNGAESGIIEIGWSVKRLFCRSRSAHMLCVWFAKYRIFVTMSYRF